MHNTNMLESDKKTIYCGNLPEQVTEELLYELFLQAGPVDNVRIPRDKAGYVKSYGFVMYSHEVSVPYALNLFRGTTLFNRTITLQFRGQLPLLPPPIRCVGPDLNIDFTNQSTVENFAKMAEKLHEKQNPKEAPQQKEPDNQLMMASLQGNWTHRHHPYRAKEKGQSRDYCRPHDRGSHRNRDKPSSNWRDRRHNKPHYQRRD